jgi:succinate dehydrogenase/fumarate reductase flavoprotein subunit
MMECPALLAANDIAVWHETADVVVVGFGIAGACAALEARRGGADVLVAERASGGGGASALSSGLFYLGGGTPVQQAVGVEDTPENMYKFLMASTGAPDAELVRTFCAGAVAHFNWLEAQGVTFERSYFKGKAVELNASNEGLCGTGNEKVWPFRDIAAPAARGHRVSRPGQYCGAMATQALIARCQEEGVRVRYDTQATALVEDLAGRIIGVRLRSAGQESYVRARKAVVLATGGFSASQEMMAEFAPHMLENCEALGVPYNDGAGMRLGRSAGGALQAMSGLIATASFYPPAQLIKGVLVNSRGERFVAEDSYHGRTASFIMEQPERKAYLIVDAEIFAYPEITYLGHRLVDGWESIAEMEAGLDLPNGSLQRTMTDYNRNAATGNDPVFFKHPDWVKPLDQGPWAAFDVSFHHSRYLFITLGGLKVNARAEVLSAQGLPIGGLYAAGACASTIPQDGKGYASGLSLGPGSFFGRVAGREAAGA